MRDALALLDLCVGRIGGTAEELASEPSVVDVSLFGVETVPVDLRGRMEALVSLGGGAVVVVVLGVVDVGGSS